MTSTLPSEKKECRAICKPSLVISTSVSSPLKRRLLLRGSLLAGLGIGILTIVGTQFSAPHLSTWGVPALFVGIMLITLGLLPYRQISKLELNPHQLILMDHRLFYITKGTCKLSIPLRLIKSKNFICRHHMYGIGIWLNNPMNRKIKIPDTSFDIRKFHAHSRKIAECDFFFPYFSSRAYEELVLEEKTRKL